MTPNIILHKIFSLIIRAATIQYQSTPLCCLVITIKQPHPIPNHEYWQSRLDADLVHLKPFHPPLALHSVYCLVHMFSSLEVRISEKYSFATAFIFKLPNLKSEHWSWEGIKFIKCFLSILQINFFLFCNCESFFNK